MIDSTLNRLLWRWGRAKIIVSNGWYKAAPGFSEYQTPGYPDILPYNDYDDSIDEMTALIGKVLNEPQRQAIKCKYRWGYNINKSARFLNCSRDQYMAYFNQAIAILTVEVVRK